MANCTKGWAERCSHARSAKCECSCGGQNHGARPTVTDQTTETLVLVRLEKGVIRGDLQSRQVSIDGKLLSPLLSLSKRNHSPDGFNWGYGGSGPAQLALGILLAVTDEETALARYQEFKWAIVAKLEDNFRLPIADVKLWLSTTPAI